MDLNQLVATLQHGDNWIKYLEMAARFYRYSFQNVVLILSQKPDATQVMGCKRWSEYGRRVRKGEKGIQILAPRVGKRELPDASGKIVEVPYTYYVTAYVFDVSQTEGPDQPVVETPDAGRIHTQLVRLTGTDGSTEDLLRLCARALLVDAKDKVLETDAVVYIILTRLGLPTSHFQFGRLHSWGQGQDAVDQLKQAGSRIMKTVQRILNDLEKDGKAEAA